MLGAGGMGVVYRATDELLGREVALKVLPPEAAGNEDRRKRFLREARLAAAVTHPAIATVYEVGEANGQIFIAMELVPGETLRRRMAGGLMQSEIVRIACDIARGLGRAHAKGVVHRDLKPDNVMVTPEGEAKILDFGLAKLWEVAPAGTPDETTLSQLTAQGHVVGTAAYMSPEQIEGRPDIDARSDVFSFGVMLYELVAGVRPFRGTTSVEILYLVLNGDPEPLDIACPQVSPELAVIVERCLRKVPAERFASGSEVADALAAVGGRLASGPISASPVDASELLAGKTHVFAARPPGADERGDTPWPVPPSSAAIHGVPTAPALTKVLVKARPSRRRFWVGATAGLCTLALGAGIVWARHLRAVKARTPGQGVAMTDHPLPESSNREAVAHYASALSRLRVGALESAMELEKAAALDPALAPAQLRLALYGDYYQLPEADRRRHFTQATALASSLEPRDQALLPVAEAIAHDPIDYNVALARIGAAAERYPNDAEIALLRYLLLFKAERPEAEAMSRQVLKLDPKATQIFLVQVRRALSEGKTSVAAILVDRCIELSPEASTCRDARMAIEAEQGKCDAMLDDARELVNQEPDVPAGYERLAQALAATGAPPESIQSVLDQAETHEIASATRPKELTKLELAVLVGDFVTAERVAADLVPVVATTNSELENGYVAMLRIMLAEETGGRASALALAETFAKQAIASTENAPLEVRAKRLFLLHEAGRLSDSGLDAELKPLLDEALKASKIVPFWTVLGTFRKLVHPSASKEQSEKNLRFFVDAAYAETASEAKSAVEAADPLPISLETLRSSMFYRRKRLEFGRLMLLAGRVDDAIPLLRSFEQNCTVIGNFNLFDLTTSIEYLHAQLFLGEALEAKGDIAGACQAYGVVESRWRNARPRSRTVELASERAHALRCATTEHE